MTQCSRCFSIALALLLCVVNSAGVLAGTNDNPAATSARPKIGLVLGGGGALGMAHVGVLRALEREHIPVDYIAGTSMGAIIGGLYAAGRSPDEIEALLVGMDWWDVLKDKTARRDRDFRRKQEDERYLMDIEMGLKGARLIFPHGLASGQKFNNIMQTFTVNAAGTERFDDLNVPFRSVATDLRTGNPYIFDHGNLATAMRASMAVPGAFTPVQIGEHILVDGGLVDNIPVGLARSMGAQIVIAVDVGGSLAEAAKKSDFTGLGPVLGRTYDIMRRPQQEASVKTADIVVVPDLTGFSASSFEEAAAIIPRGEAGADAVVEQLRRFAVSAEEYKSILERQRRKRVGEITLASVSVTGNQNVATAVIRSKIESKPGDTADFKKIHRDVARIHGIGDFQAVNYRLIPGEDGRYDLRYETQEKFWGTQYLRMGLRLQSDADGNANWGFLLNDNMRQLNEAGGELSIDLEGGSEQRIGAEWYQPVSAASHWFFAPAAEYSSERLDYYEQDERVAEFDFTRAYANLDAGLTIQEYGEARVGVRVGSIDGVPETQMDELVEDIDDDFGALTASLAVDRLDRIVFARKGYLFRLSGLMAEESLWSDYEYAQAELRIRWYHSIREHTLQFGVRAGHSFDDEVPAYDQFTLGGPSFVGVPIDGLRGPEMGVARLGYSYRFSRLAPSMGDGIYALGMLDAGSTWASTDDVDLDDSTIGVGAGLGLDTVLGPILLFAGKAEDFSTQYFLSLGSVF